VSAASGRTVSNLLHEVSARLTGPLPTRTRFLEELASDLEELTAHLVASGLTPEQARTRAVEALVPDESTAAWLAHLHAPLYARATRGWQANRLRLIERGLLTAAFVVVLALQGVAVLRMDLIAFASPALWAVLASGSMVVVALIAKGFQLWIKRDHVDLRKGLGTIPALSAVPPFLGLVGVWADVHQLAATLEASPELAPELVLGSLIQDAALLAVAILLALVGAIGWLAITQWIVIHEDAHRRALDLDHPLTKEI
jgi:hypothetical protein